MNHVYRLVWSTTHNALIAVSETSRARGKTGGRSSKVVSAVASALLALSGASAALGALPALAADEVVSSEIYRGLSYGSVDSFTNTSLIISPETAVNITGNVSSGITNSGVISSYSYGVAVGGVLLGGFTNSSNGLLLSRGISTYVTGELQGDFTNEGRIFSHDSHGVFVSALMTGDFTNTSTGQIKANDVSVLLSGGLIGNFNNYGEISSGDCHGIVIKGAGMTGDFLNGITGRIYTNEMAVDINGGLNGNFTNQGKIVGLTTHGVHISGGMTGTFLNTSTGQMIIEEIAVNIIGDFTGNMTNQGNIVSGDSYGFYIGGSFNGNFSNTVGSRIWANQSVLHMRNFSYNNPEELYSFNGNISNAGMMYGASGGILIGGAMTGNFTNEATGVIEGGISEGVIFGGGVTGNINNAGSILGERYFGTAVVNSTLPVIELSRNYGTQFYRDDVDNGYVELPDHIGYNPKAGIYVHGDLNGDFINSGSIRAAQAVFIDGDLNGDYSNTGTIDGGFVGLTATAGENEPSRRITGNRSFTGNSVVIAGNFNGNFTTAVGQGILVGAYVNDWTRDVGLVPQNATTVSLQAGTGTADLISKTVAVHVNQAISNGYTWTAIDSANLLYDNGFAITDNSLLYDFTYVVENDDLKITAVLNGIPETPVTSSSEYNGVTYTANGFTVAAGTTFLNGGTAVDVSGDVSGNVTGDIINSGEIISTGYNTRGVDNSGRGYGIYISGNLNGNFDNTTTGKINASLNAALFIQGNMTGNLSNSGEISSGDCHAVLVQGSMTGDFTNSQSGRIYANDMTVMLRGGIDGNITNHGLIISGSSHAIFVSQTMTGNFVNSASAGIYANDMAFKVAGALNGNITNAGEIVSSDCHAFHISGLMTGNFLNAATGHIWSNDIAVQFSSGLLGNFTNEGEIVSGDCYGIYSYANVTGNFLNSAGASIWAGSDIAVQFSTSFTGDFTNNGEILSGSSHGVWIGNMTSGDFVNGATGEIRALNNAVQVNKTFNGDFTNHGLIASSGYVYENDPSYYDCYFNGNDYDCTFIPLPITREYRGSGVVVSGYDQIYDEQSQQFVDDLNQPYFMTGTFTNSATGSIIGFGSGVHIRAGLDGDLNNLGLIKANAGDAIKLGGVLTGTISNSGTLEATNGAGINVTSSVTGGQINNSGSIDSTDDESGNTGAGSGIYVADGSALTSVTNTSTGTIKGSFKSINLANATNPTTVNNSGVLDGDVYLGTAGNVLNINGDVARVIGNVANDAATSTVNINGTFTSEGTFNVGLFNVNDGGLFNMNHSITATTTTVNNGGTLNVGTGDRNIVGDYLQSSSGTLRFSLTNPTTYGSLNVSGNATVSDGAKIDVVLNGTPGSRINGVLIAGGTLTTNPANIVVTDNSAFYNFSASTTRDNLEIDLISEIDQNGFAAGTTRPTKGIAGALQNMLNNGIPGSLQSTYDALGAMDPAQRNNALLQMTPALQGATTQAVVNSLRNMNRIIQSRYESVQGLSSGDASNEQAVWFKTFGNRGDQGNSNTVPGYDSQSYGMVFGADKLITEQTRAGALFTYVRTDIDSNVGNANVNVDSYKIATYASYNIDPKTDINFQMDYGVHRADSARSIGFMGTRAKADFDGTDWHIAAGIGHTIDLTEKSSITPSLRLDYTNFRTDSYTEKGAGALNNHVKSAVYEEFLLDMGAKFTHQLNDNGLKFIANGGVAYDFINETAQATSNLIGGGPSFVTRGLDPSPWLYRGGLGLVKAADSGMEVSARYDVEGRSSDYINQTASINLRWSF